MEKLSNGPSRALLSQFPSEDKGFQDQKGGLLLKNRTSIFASQPHIKMERLSSGPSRALLTQFTSGVNPCENIK